MHCFLWHVAEENRLARYAHKWMAANPNEFLMKLIPGVLLHRRACRNTAVHLMKRTLPEQDDVIQVLPGERALEYVKVG